MCSKMQLSVKIIFTLLLVSFVAFTTCQSLEDSDDAVVLMTTVEPIDGEGSVSFKNSSTNIGVEGNGNCTNVSDCSTCNTQGCNWVECEGVVEGAHCTDTIAEACSPAPCVADPCSNFTLCEACVASSSTCSWLNCGGSSASFCSSSLAEECQQVDCNADNVTTIAPDPDNTTTTTATPDTNTTTTEPPTTTTIITTTLPDTTTTTDSPNDTTTTTEEPATTTAVPTTVPTTAPTTSAPPPAPATGGFSAGSFFGGITLTLALLAVGYGGFKFYKTRYDVNYRTL